MQTSVPVGTTTMKRMIPQLDQLDQPGATTAGQTALDGLANMMVVSPYLKQEA
jgi:hypothetical protein